VVAAREVSGEVVVLRDATDEGVAAPLEALRPRLSGLRVAVVVAADVVALAAFGWLYLRELIHVFPQWPNDRHLELCPRDWARTRSRLVASELEREFGPITVPPAEKQS
jgi:hypothetical protein